MPTNNFKLFDENKANLLSDTEYANATQRLNGVQTGVASSQLNNKFAYQVSLVAYAIAQIMNQNGLDASDTLAVSAFVGNLGGALLQKVADKASTAEAAAGVLTNKYISPATMKAAALLLSGGVMSGTLNMNNNKITNLPTPSTPSEPATKGYVDGKSSKILSEKITVNEDLGLGGFKAIELQNKIDVNDANAIGIKVTFNNTLTIINTDSRNYRNFYIKFCSINICYAYVKTSSELVYANAGQSFFIPLFMLPVLYPISNFNYGLSTGRSILPILSSFNNLNVLFDNFNPNNQDIQLSVDNMTKTRGLNITFDIYKMYF